MRQYKSETKVDKGVRGARNQRGEDEKGKRENEAREEGKKNKEKTGK